MLNNQRGFDFIVNISEDAWFGQSIGPYQHFTKAIYRSIENGSYTVRSANMGVSAFISPTGKILKIPSVSEIMNLVRKAPDKKSNSKSSQRNHIYFYGN